MVNSSKSRTYEEEKSTKQLNEYCVNEAQSIWSTIKKLLSRPNKTPFLIFNENNIQFNVVCEEDEDDNIGYTIFDSEAILIYPTKFQEWFYKKFDEKYVVNELSKKIAEKL